MNVRTFPAAYLPHFTLGVERLLREIQYDITMRGDTDPKIQGLAWMPKQLIDARETGEAVVLVSAVNDGAVEAALATVTAL